MTEKESYATFYERLLARMIDNLFYLLIFLLPVASILAAPDFNGLLNRIFDFSLFAATLPFLIFPFEVFMTSKFKGTPGKILTGLRVEKTGGKALNYKESFIRLTLGKAVSGLFFCLGYFWVFRSEKKQAWHDIINESVVIKHLKYGWLIGLLILIIFLLADLSLFTAIAGRLISNIGFYRELLF